MAAATVSFGLKGTGSFSDIVPKLGFQGVIFSLDSNYPRQMCYNINMAIKFGPKLRKLYAEKTFDLTNIGAGALLFGQFLSEEGFSWLATGVGLVLVVIGYVTAYSLYQGGEKK